LTSKNGPPHFTAFTLFSSLLAEPRSQISKFFRYFFALEGLVLGVSGVTVTELMGC